MPIPVITPPEPPGGGGGGSGGGGGGGGGGTPGPTIQPRHAFGVSISDRVGRTLVLDTATSSAPYVLRPGVTGLDMPPVGLTSDALPDEDGSILRSLRFVERDMFLPIWIPGDSHEQCRDRSRELLSVLNPRKSSDPFSDRNIVDVMVAQPDGAVRVISGYYVGGAEGSYSSAEYGVEWRVLGATIRCLDPMWHSGDVAPLTFITAPSAKSLLSTSTAFFPIQLGTSQVLGSVTLNNPGDVDAYMVWDITGPGSGFTATNVTTGQTLTLTADLTGKVVTIDTRRLAQTITDQLGANLFGSVTGDLWPLIPGDNEVTLSVTGATTGSQVVVTPYVRWLSA